MYEVIAYRCSHCGNLKGQKSNMRKHEKNCFRNPESKSCITCASFFEGNDYKPRSCYKGKDLSKKLITKCTKYFSKPEFLE